MLFLCTSVLVFIAFASMSVFTLIVDQGWLSEVVTTKMNFVPMVCVIVAYVGYGLGYGVIPSLMAAEAMPVDVRSFAIGLFMVVEMSSIFLSSKLKPILLEKLHLYGMFIIFTCGTNDCSQFTSVSNGPRGLPRTEQCVPVC